MSEEKIKVESLDIIVTMIDGKPYYEIKYKEVGKRHYNIGYSSYDLDFVLEWKEKWFEVVENKAAKDTHVPGKWILCSERLPEDEQIVIVAVGSDYGNRRYLFAYYKIDDHMDCWRNANTGFRIWCSVIAWMPLPEPYKENDDEGQANT